MSKKILVTGVNGFVGKHLVRELHGQGHSVFGIGNQEPDAHPETADILDIYIQCDITKENEVSKLKLDGVDCIINLAGLANVGASFNNPDLYMKVNVEVLSVLGKELLRQNSSARMIAISSGALYDPNQTMPLSESSKVVEAGSPYAMSKLAMEQSAGLLREQGLDCIVVRPFNHIGPSQGLGFLIPDLVEKLRIIDSNKPKITAGNLKTVRDYTDVRDIARAYANLAVAPTLSHNLYNVCSGKGLAGDDIIQALCVAMNIDFSKLQIVVDQSLMRPTDPPKIIGDNSLLKQDTGWSPSISIDKTVADIIKSLV